MPITQADQGEVVFPHRHTPRNPEPAAGVVLSLSKQTTPPTPKRLPFAHHPFAEGSWLSFVDGFPPIHGRTHRDCKSA